MLNPARRTARIVGSAMVMLLAFGLVTACSSDKKSSTPTTAPAASAASELKAGIKAQVAGDTKAATAKFVAVIGLDPTNKLAHYNLGLIQQNAGNTTASEANYRGRSPPTTPMRRRSTTWRSSATRPAVRPRR